MPDMIGVLFDSTVRREVAHIGNVQHRFCGPLFLKLVEFIDFILSEEVQNIWGSTLTNRPVLKDAATSEFMTPMSDIYVIEEDIPYVSSHKQELVDRYTEIFTDLQSR